MKKNIIAFVAGAAISAVVSELCHNKKVKSLVGNLSNKISDRWAEKSRVASNSESSVNGEAKVEEQVPVDPLEEEFDPIPVNE
jgi:hypothetical protein